MVAYCKKHIHAGILCSAVLLAVLPSLGYTETVKDFRDPEGRLFEDYRYFPAERHPFLRKITPAIGVLEDCMEYFSNKE